MTMTMTMTMRMTAGIAMFAGLCVAASLSSGTRAASPTAAQLREKKALSLAAAKKMAGIVEAEAAKAGVAVTIVVVDDGGKLIYLSAWTAQ